MYLAEIRGKLSPDNENKEDILTSNVFSFFKYAPRDIFLFRLAVLLDLKISKDDAINAEFHFWPVYDDYTEPDLVIIIGKYYVLIEAKYLSGFGQESGDVRHQLVREIEGGMAEAASLGKQFRMVAITADYILRKEKYPQVTEDVWRVTKWTNWQSIALLLHEVNQNVSNLPLEVRAFREDLYLLFLKKDLRNYAGMRSLRIAGRLSKLDNNLFLEPSTVSLRGDFIGFQESITISGTLLQVEGDLFFKDTYQFFAGMLKGSNRVGKLDLPLFYKE